MAERVSLERFVAQQELFALVHRDDLKALDRVVAGWAAHDDVPWAVARAATERNLPVERRPEFRAVEALLSWRGQATATLSEWETRYKAGLELFALVAGRRERAEVFWNVLDAFDPAHVKRFRRTEVRDFEPDAALLTEQYVLRRTRLENRVRCAHVVLEALVTGLIAACGRETGRIKELASYWFEDHAIAEVIYPTSPRPVLWGVAVTGLSLIEAAMRAVRKALPRFPAPPALVRRLTREAQDRRLHVWIQAAAVRALAVLEPQLGADLYEHRLQAHDQDDAHELFLRQALVAVLPEYLPLKRARRAVQRVLEGPEPSEYVQITACAAAVELADASTLMHLRPLCTHPSPVTRAKAIAAYLQTGVRLNPDGPVWNDIAAIVVPETDASVLRHLSEDVLDGCKQTPDTAAGASRLLRTLLRRADLPGASRTWLTRAQNLATLWTVPWYREYHAPLAGLILDLVPGSTAKIPHGLWPLSLPELCRLLTTLSDKNHGLEVRPVAGGFLCHYGDRYRVRLWRTLHEAFRLASDKRVAFPHHRGRAPRWRWRIPPFLMAEQTPTKVPGERVYIDAAECWVPFVPMIEDYLSVLGVLRPASEVVISSHFGRTTIAPPRFRARRLVAALRLTRRFAREAEHRLEWLAADPYVQGPLRFFEHMHATYGCVTTFEPWEGAEMPALAAEAGKEAVAVASEGVTLMIRREDLEAAEPDSGSAHTKHPRKPTKKQSRRTRRSKTGAPRSS